MLGFLGVAGGGKNGGGEVRRAEERVRGNGAVVDLDWDRAVVVKIGKMCGLVGGWVVFGESVWCVVVCCGVVCMVWCGLGW